MLYTGGQQANTGVDQSQILGQILDDMRRRREQQTQPPIISPAAERKSEGGQAPQPTGLLTDPHSSFVMNPKATGAGSGETALGNAAKIMGIASGGKSMASGGGGGAG